MWKLILDQMAYLRPSGSEVQHNDLDPNLSGQEPPLSPRTFSLGMRRKHGRSENGRGFTNISRN